MGRDEKSKKFNEKRKISTHTPAWGATKGNNCAKRGKLISTHTPAWGATGDTGAQGATGANFNSHARVGRDNNIICADPKTGISTHTPAWGATTAQTVESLRETFQLTRPRGARHGIGVYGSKPD